MAKILIKNVRYFDGTDCFKTGNIYINNGLYCTPFNDNEASDIIDGSGLTAIPGLIDLHLHGCNGYDVCDNSIEVLHKISEYQQKNGIAYFAPATMTLPIDELCRILNTIQEYYHMHINDYGAKILGINLEGPFINPNKCGAQDKSYAIPCNNDVFDKLMNSSSGLILIIDIAPEIKNALNLIRYIKQAYNNKLIISIAHTEADYDCTINALNAGASNVTHIFNAMPPFHHRSPGVIGAVSDYGNCTVELICDGIHVHPAMIRTAFKLFSPENIIFISDSMRATGLSDGIYTLGGQNVLVNGRTATLSKNGAIAGSVCNLMDCLRYAVLNAGIKPETAVTCAVLNPAKRIGINNKYGCIKTGQIAKLILIDDNWNIIRNLLSP